MTNQNNKINTAYILELLHKMNDQVQEVHGDSDDDLGAIVWNTCMAIEEELKKAE